MRNKLKTLITAGGVMILLASVAVTFLGGFTNVPGDGIRPRGTITSNLLGYKRYSLCSWVADSDDTERGWDCDDAIVEVPDAYERDLAEQASPPVARVVAEYMSEWWEMLIGILLMLYGWGSSPPKKEEKGEVATQ